MTIYPQWVYTCVMHSIKKDKLIKRLNIIEGQVRGLKEMLESGVYCIDVITQTDRKSTRLNSSH